MIKHLIFIFFFLLVFISESISIAHAQSVIGYDIDNPIVLGPRDDVQSYIDQGGIVILIENNEAGEPTTTVVMPIFGENLDLIIDPNTGLPVTPTPGGACKANGVACTSSSSCCSNSCTGPQVAVCGGIACTYQNTCVNGPTPTPVPPTPNPTTCLGAGTSCSVNNDCCSNSCPDQGETCTATPEGPDCAPNPRFCVNAPTPTPTPTPVQTVTILGRFVDATGTTFTTNIGQSVTIDGNNPVGFGNGIFWSNVLTPGTHTVTATVPAGYTVTASPCTNCISHLAASFTGGNTVSVNLPTGGNYADIYFKYTPSVCSITFDGRVVTDPATTTCSALGGSTYSGTGTVTAYNGSSPAQVQAPLSSGTYSNLTYAPACGGSSFVTLSGVSSSVIGVCDNGVYYPNNGYSYPYTNTGLANTTRTITFLVSSQASWFQVGTGDVRFPNLVNSMPTGLSVSTTGSSLFTSSNGTVSFGGGVLSPTADWTVSNEYSYNTDFANGLGSMSYTFYLGRAKQRNVSITPISTPTVNLSTLASGVYQRIGDLDITAPTGITGGKHIVLLVSETATVTQNISVPPSQNNLFVLASKGNIVFSPTVGSTVSSTTPSIDGYYTSEQNIVLSGTNNCAISPDLRLNVGGSLVANSLRPYATGGAGKIVISRNICQNQLYPTYFVTPRPDFLLQMTDFYKLTYKTFQEVNP